MTTSNYKKEFKQLKAKPFILKKYIKHNSPKVRTCGSMLRKCKRCGKTGSHISKYGLGLCRYCFREIALQLGFKKYS